MSSVSCSLPSTAPSTWRSRLPTMWARPASSPSRTSSGIDPMILLLTPEESFVPFLQGLVGNGVEISRKWDPGWRDAQPIDVVQSTIHPVPDIVIIGPTVPEAVALEWAGAFDREQPEVGRLIIAPATPDLLMG